MYERACEHCGTAFATEYASKRFCTRRCKEAAKERRARLELQAYQLTVKAPGRWHRLRVALRWAWTTQRSGQRATSPAVLDKRPVEPLPPRGDGADPVDTQDCRGGAYVVSGLRDGSAVEKPR